MACACKAPIPAARWKQPGQGIVRHLGSGRIAIDVSRVMFGASPTTRSLPWVPSLASTAFPSAEDPSVSVSCNDVVKAASDKTKIVYLPWNGPAISMPSVEPPAAEDVYAGIWPVTVGGSNGSPVVVYEEDAPDWCRDQVRAIVANQYGLASSNYDAHGLPPDPIEPNLPHIPIVLPGPQADPTSPAPTAPTPASSGSALSTGWIVAGAVGAAGIVGAIVYAATR